MDFYNSEIVLNLETTQGKKEKSMIFSVADEGHGIPEASREAVYDPLSRHKFKDPLRVIRGTGMGLWVAKRVIQCMGGKIYHTSDPINKLKTETTDRHVIVFTIEMPLNWQGDWHE